MIKVAVAEDNRFLLKSVEEKLSFFDDINYKFHGVSGLDLLQKLEQDHNIDIVLMDIQMPELDGIKTTEIIRQKYPHIKVVMLTVFDDDENIFNAIMAGASGYLLKETDPESLHDGIIDTMNGGAGMTPVIALKTLKLLRDPGRKDVQQPAENTLLSERETGILEQLSTGLSYTQIANNLFIAPGTVRKHIENIYRKLEVHNKVEALQKASKYGII